MIVESKIQNLKWLGILALLVGYVGMADAQQQPKVPRVGYLDPLSPSTDSTRIEAFRQGLRELGYIEGKNTVVEYRSAEGKVERFPEVAAELVRLSVDVILAAGGERLALPTKNASKTIPIVFTHAADPVGSGLVVSLARPGGNITGLTVLSPELGGKRLELLKEVVHRLARVAVLGNPDGPTYSVRMKEFEVAARALGLQIQPVELRAASDLENIFAAITRGRAGAFIGLQSPELTLHRRRIAELAVRNRLPSIHGDSEFAEAGGLMSYGPSYADLFRRAATYVDKILKGTKPADLPVQQPTKFEFIINLKAAKQIGLTIPPNVLARADKVIK